MKLLKIIIILFLFIFYFNNIIFSKEFKYGFIDINGNIVIQLKYNYAYPFYEGVAAVEYNNKYGFINKDNKVIIDFKYDYAVCFKEGLSAVGKNNKIGFIDIRGNVIIPIIYDEATAFVDGISAVGINKKVGFINKEGKYITELKYDDLSFLSDGFINVKLNKKWGYLDSNGKEVIEFKFDYASPFYDGYAYVGENGKFGFIDKTGKYIFEPILEFLPDTSFNKSIQMENISNYNLRVENGYFTRTFFLNKTNRFVNGLSKIIENKKYGFIDKNGNKIIPTIYDYALPFKGELALVEIKNNNENIYYYINNKNEKKLSFLYPLIPVTNNIDIEFLHIVDKKNNEVILMDLNGKELFRIKDKKVGFFDNSEYAIIVTQKNKFGLIDRIGKEVIPPIYDYILPFSEDLAVVGIYK
jgi:hypothetical protein